MKKIKIQSTRDLKYIAQRLKRGELIVYPTDTAYALGGDATLKKVVEKIFSAKGRKFKKPLPCIVSSLEMLEKYCILKKEVFLLASCFWPGPLTIILEKKNPLLLAGNEKTVAVRIPNNKIAQSLLGEFKKPIISTSANLSGLKECYSPEEVLKQFQRKGIKKFFEIIVDSGPLPKISPSTILDLTKRKPVILRPGPIKKKDIFKVLSLNK